MPQISLVKKWEPEPANFFHADHEDEQQTPIITSFKGGLPSYYAVNSSVAVVDIFIEWAKSPQSDSGGGGTENVYPEGNIALCLTSTLVAADPFNPYRAIHYITQPAIPLVTINHIRQRQHTNTTAFNKDQTWFNEVRNRSRRDKSNIFQNLEVREFNAERRFYHCQPTQLSYYKIICPKLDEAEFSISSLIDDDTEKPRVKQIVVRLDICAN